MSYIVDMTLILRNLHRLLRNEKEGISTPLTKEHLKRVAEEYKISTIKEDVHTEIREFVAGINFGAKLDSDRPLQEIKRLVKDPRYDPDSREL
jgi:hypothetical protein